MLVLRRDVVPEDDGDQAGARPGGTLLEGLPALRLGQVQGGSPATTAASSVPSPRLESDEGAPVSTWLPVITSSSLIRAANGA